jgi:hypothetical protein
LLEVKVRDRESRKEKLGFSTNYVAEEEVAGADTRRTRHIGEMVAELTMATETKRIKAKKLRC